MLFVEVFLFVLHDPCVLTPADMQILAGYSSQLHTWVGLSQLGEPYTTSIVMHASIKHEKYWTEPCS